MENKPKGIPHKTLAKSRVITLQLKLPSGHMKPHNPAPRSITALREREKNKFLSTEPSIDPHTPSKIELLHRLYHSRWQIPQPVDSKSPQGKALPFLRDIIKSETKLDKTLKRSSPDIDFFRQTQRMPMPKPIFHEEKLRFTKTRPKSAEKTSKKFVLVKENVLKEIEIIFRKTCSKSPLRGKLLI